MEFHYVYILQSVSFQNRYYMGLTEDLRKRLRKTDHLHSASYDSASQRGLTMEFHYV